MRKRLDISKLLNRLGWDENVDLEYKSAKGGLPRSAWETYSAMANTDGGIILLGVENDKTISGLPDPPAIRRNIWNNVNNRQIVSINLLKEDDVQEIELEIHRIIVIRIPRATRNQRPVFTGLNPLVGTYRRNFEGDYHCTEEEVGRMLADRSSEPADNQILENYTLADLDEQSIKQYMQRFSARTPTHPWINEDIIGFLTKLGGWRKDRKTGTQGPTVAGLIMFGTDNSIREAIPGFHLDYRERLSDDPSVRWTDRLTIDGMWEANAFQFYLKVIQKLSSHLKLPFQLDSNLLRKGETIVHEAIREAMVNALIHADYKGEGGIIVEKYKDRLEISNPGTLLVSFEQLLRGGISECRNKRLQTMFLMIGAAEKAGSGIDKIRQGWLSQHWRSPRISEQVQPDRFQLLLPMVSLIPEESIVRLKMHFGRRFNNLKEHEVLALVTADVEKEVSNSRMRQITDLHSSDITKMLQRLVGKGYLKQKGQGRWTAYHLPEPKVRVLKGSVHKPQQDSVHIEKYSTHKNNKSTHKKWDSSLMLDDLPGNELRKLKQIASPAISNRRLKPAVTKKIIQELCMGRFLTISHIAELLNRNPDALRFRFIKPMVNKKLLRLRYPNKPNRPDQAYTAEENADGE